MTTFAACFIISLARKSLLRPSNCLIPAGVGTLRVCLTGTCQQAELTRDHRQHLQGGRPVIEQLF